MPTFKPIASLTSLLFLAVLPTARGQKPPLTLDELFNAVDIRSVQISPDGHAVVIWLGHSLNGQLSLFGEVAIGIGRRLGGGPPRMKYPLQRIRRTAREPQAD